jgi:hypothetical protein
MVSHGGIDGMNAEIEASLATAEAALALLGRGLLRPR